MKRQNQFFRSAIGALIVATLVASLQPVTHSHAQDAGTNAPPPEFDTSSEPKVAQAAQINLSPALAEVVRLAQSGADETVVVTYVQKAPAYTISADEIIYLQDLGISDGVLKALVEHGKSGAVGAAPPPVNRPPTVGAPPVVPAAPPVTPAAPVPEPTPVAPPPAPVAAPAPVSPPASVTEFYQPLSPYGTWVIVEPYGWCWQPTVVAVNATWSPYCDNGNWLWSDSGWYWHSYYSWGWAPFHYGRWFYHPHRRWVWMPDRVWGPSWVCWRESPSYYGWAPLPPGAHFSVGVGWTYGGRHVGSDFAFGISVGHFTFVGANHFTDRHIRERRLPPRQVNVVINNTKVVNNYAVGSGNRIINRGVDRGRVESVTGTRVREVAVREMPQPKARAAATVMPDRVTRVGGSDVVYRPGPKIEVPQKPATTAIGQKEALLRQDAPLHQKPARQDAPLTPSVQPRPTAPRIEAPISKPAVPSAPNLPGNRNAPPQPVKPSPAIPPSTAPVLPPRSAPQTVPPKMSPAPIPARPAPPRPPAYQAPKGKQGPE